MVCGGRHSTYSATQITRILQISLVLRRLAFKLHTQGFLKLLYHEDSLEGWDKVNFVGLVLQATWIVSSLVTACNVIYHP